ncbi:MAG: NrdH-redoxin [Bacillaceae bacterium]|nr:NrdH-redoxin [Bacillaceae bacterium]
MNVTVYSQPDCPPCNIVKEFLSYHQITYKEIDISKNIKDKNFLMNELQSYSTPTVVVENEVIKGFDIKALANALKIEE